MRPDEPRREAQRRGNRDDDDDAHGSRPLLKQQGDVLFAEVKDETGYGPLSQAARCVTAEENRKRQTSKTRRSS
jgi:hypothetical protein